MKRALALLASLVPFVTRTAVAAPAGDSELARHDLQVEAQAHFGVATAPFDVSTLHQAKGQAFVFLAAARYALTQALALELRMPWVLGSVAQPAGSYVDAAAMGNPQLGTRLRVFERRFGESALAWSVGFELGAPLATHRENLMPNRALAIADGLEGRGHPEWFTPGVVPLTASTDLRWTSPSWSIVADLRSPLLVRVSDADLPGYAARPKDVGLATIFGVEARYRVSQPLSLAAAAHLFFDLAPAVEHVRRLARVQDFERVSLYIRFAASVALVVDLQTALGWELHGSTVAGGLRLVGTIR